MEESFLIIVLFLLFFIIPALLIWLVITGKIEFEDTKAIKNTLRIFRTNPPYYRGVPKKRIDLLNINTSYLQEYEDIWKEQILIKTMAKQIIPQAMRQEEKIHEKYF